MWILPELTFMNMSFFRVPSATARAASAAGALLAVRLKTICSGIGCSRRLRDLLQVEPDGFRGVGRGREGLQRRDRQVVEFAPDAPSAVSLAGRFEAGVALEGETAGPVVLAHDDEAESEQAGALRARAHQGVASGGQSGVHRERHR